MHMELLYGRIVTLHKKSKMTASTGQTFNMYMYI